MNISINIVDLRVSVRVDKGNVVIENHFVEDQRLVVRMNINVIRNLGFQYADCVCGFEFSSNSISVRSLDE